MGAGYAIDNLKHPRYVALICAERISWRHWSHVEELKQILIIKTIFILKNLFEINNHFRFFRAFSDKLDESIECV